MEVSRIVSPFAVSPLISNGSSWTQGIFYQVIEDAERMGFLRPHTGSRIFEGTVGSTGISIATIARARYAVYRQVSLWTVLMLSLIEAMKRVGLLLFLTRLFLDIPCCSYHHAG